MLSLPEILSPSADLPWVQILAVPCPHCSEPQSFHLGSGSRDPSMHIVEGLKEDSAKCLVRGLALGKCSTAHSISLGWSLLSSVNSH